MKSCLHRFLFLLFFSFSVSVVLAQTTVTGKVTDVNGNVVTGASVLEKGTTNGTITDINGTYSLQVSSSATLVFSFVGYVAQEAKVEGRSTVNVLLEEDTELLGEVQIVGSRNANRSSLETPVAVDVIDLTQLVTTTGQLDINQLLQVVAPSFNSNRQSGADGADHIDPASLRGLGPDQTLVLINGKRRHQSSLVNIFGSRGRGNSGTDLNAIPVAAIERIEILRDGAAAQYGSDAIAGVINIVLKSRVNEVSGNVSVGTRNASAPNGSGPVDDGSGTYPTTSLGSNRFNKYDGGTYQVNLNYGSKIGEKGFINFTTDFLRKNHTYRAADPDKNNDLYMVRRNYGDAALDQFSLWMNSSFEISPNTSFYAFGGFSYKATDAFAYTRGPSSARNVPEIYPNGFDPHITSDISDKSLSFGLKSKVGNWDVDINNTFGVNRFHFIIDKTLNTSLQQKSPTRFDAGGFQLSQNTTGVYFSQYFKNAMKGVNIAFGTEYRIDNYRIFAGEEGSWKNYGVVDSVSTGGYVVPVDTLGVAAGSQGFPGFQPSNEVNAFRQNLGLYVDGEFNFTENFMVAAAARYENYSDFGNTLNGKLATRLQIMDGLAVRGSFSSGFRAPSLAQSYYNTVYTTVSNGQIADELIARNNSPVTRALGIEPLKQETSINGSLGVTFQKGNFSATVDGYYIKIKDRILLTGLFSSDDPDIGADLAAVGATGARFFTNALDTKTTGLDFVFSYHTTISENQQLKISYVGNFNHMTTSDVNVNPKLAGKEDQYFDLREKYFLLASAPPSKMNLTVDYKISKFNFNVRFVRYGQVEIVNYFYYNFSEAELADAANKKVYISTFDPKVTVDASIAYDFTPNLTWTIGASNLTNVYPSRMIDPNYSETGGYWEAVQMGFSGAFYFTKVGFKF